MSYFMVPLSVLGLALPWELLSETMGTGRAVWQVSAIPSVVIDWTSCGYVQVPAAE